MARHLLVIDVELAVPYLDMVARQADDPLDVIGRRISGQLEHHDIAALWQMRERQENAAGEQWHPEGQRVAAVAVGVFRDEQIITDQQGRDHRPGRNIERFERDGADDERDQHRINDGLDGLERAARGLLFRDGL